MESYLLPQSLSAVETTADPCVATISAVDLVAQLTRVVDKLTKQMEQLQHTVHTTPVGVVKRVGRESPGRAETSLEIAGHVGGWGTGHATVLNQPDSRETSRLRHHGPSVWRQNS